MFESHETEIIRRGWKPPGFPMRTVEFDRGGYEEVKLMTARMIVPKRSDVNITPNPREWR